MKFKILHIITIFVVLVGCNEEFILDNQGYQDKLVINGTISNEQGPYTITISKSAPVNAFEEIPVEDCTVSIFEKSGDNEIYEELKEVNPGIYQTSETGIQGTIGNSYSLSIITPDGKEYITDYQEMKQPVGIESVDFELLTQDKEGFPYGLPGYQFYVSSNQAELNENYFLWRLTETYEYTNDYKVTNYFLGYETVLVNDSAVIQEISNDTLLDYFNQKVFKCWRTQSVNYFYTGKTSNLAIPKITKQPLQFVSTDTKKLSQRYSLLVKQYTIDEQAYYYWEGLEKQSSDENFLIATQPYSIIGNIKNVNDIDDLVYGYFTVASVSEKRTFADKPREPFYYTKSNVITDEETIGDILLRMDPPFYYATTEDGEGLIDEECIDCREAGGTTVKPDFWID